MSKKQYTPSEVYVKAEKLLEDMKSIGVPEVQLTIMRLSYLSLYSALVIEEIEDEQPTT